MTATPAGPAVAGPENPPTPAPTPVTRALSGGRSKAKPADQRWEVTEADLNMYALITGRAPSDSERLAALTGLTADGNPIGPSRRCRTNGRTTDLAERTWSPSVFYGYLRDFCYQGIHLTMSKPHVAAWVRNVSIDARRRLQETQARLVARRKAG